MKSSEEKSIESFSEKEKKMIRGARKELKVLSFLITEFKEIPPDLVRVELLRQQFIANEKTPKNSIIPALWEGEVQASCSPINIKKDEELCPICGNYEILYDFTDIHKRCCVSCYQIDKGKDK